MLKKYFKKKPTKVGEIVTELRIDKKMIVKKQILKDNFFFFFFERFFLVATNNFFVCFFSVNLKIRIIPFAWWRTQFSFVSLVGGTAGRLEKVFDWVWNLFFVLTSSLNADLTAWTTNRASWTWLLTTRWLAVASRATAAFWLSCAAVRSTATITGAWTILEYSKLSTQIPQKNKKCHLPTTISTSSTFAIISSTASSSSLSVWRCWSTVACHLNSEGSENISKFLLFFSKISLTSTHGHPKLVRPFPGVRLLHRVCHKTERKQSLWIHGYVYPLECKYPQLLRIFQKLFLNLLPLFDR